MKRSLFLFIAALGSFGFGGLMFFLPQTAADMLAIAPSPETLSVLRGMGGLIVGSGVINFLLRNQTDQATIKGLLWANIVTHTLGLGADLWGAADGAITLANMAPVEITHLFVGLGSLVYLLRVKGTA